MKTSLYSLVVVAHEISRHGCSGFCILGKRSEFRVNQNVFYHTNEYCRSARSIVTEKDILPRESRSYGRSRTRCNEMEFSRYREKVSSRWKWPWRAHEKCIDSIPRTYTKFTVIASDTEENDETFSSECLKSVPENEGKKVFQEMQSKFSNVRINIWERCSNLCQAVSSQLQSSPKNTTKIDIARREEQILIQSSHNRSHILGEKFVFTSSSHNVVPKKFGITHIKVQAKGIDRIIAKKSDITHIKVQDKISSIINQDKNDIISRNNNDLGNRMMSTTIQRLLTDRWSKLATNLQIVARPASNGISRLMKRGLVRSDIFIKFDDLRLRNLQISGGGQIDIYKMNVFLLGLLFPWNTPQGQLVRRRWNMKRFRSRFQLHARDCTLTQADILSSACIRNGLQNVLGRILKRQLGILSISKVIVKSVNILSSKKISCIGTAFNEWGISIPFEVRSGLDTASNGQVLKFPGLEIALGTGQLLEMFVPVLPDIDVDLGHDANLERIHFNGVSRCLTVSAKVTVTPEIFLGDQINNKIRSKDQQSLARFACDAGKFVTRIGNFTK